MSPTQQAMPLLSICIPAYNRPEWLRRAMCSILTTSIEKQSQIELIVSDDSTIPACKQVVDELIVNWHGQQHYCQNTPSLGMAGNWNHCIQIASGEYVLVLHDDDYLETAAPDKILQTLQQHSNASALLFGVNVVTSQQRIRKQQIFNSLQPLTPESALEKILTDSSFIRFPGMVLKKEIFQTIGYFDKTIGGIADIKMWVRVCHECGLLCVPIVTANYTVHDQALTMEMFNPQIVKGLQALFNDVCSQGWLSPDTLEKCKTNYFHQFILAGTVRHIRVWNITKAKQVFSLFNQLELQPGLLKLKWKIIKPVLQVFLDLSALTSGRQSSEA